MSKVHVSTTINGEPLEFLCEPHQTMLEVLRDELQLTGTKEGCGTGDCGACSILLNERLICSCLMLAMESQDQHITTVEGVATPFALHPIQRVFLEEAALQCGICTPGLMVATKALLDKTNDPSEQEIRYWLAGNLCRCTGYDKIVRAVQVAARELREAGA
jgi:aerobic carbon-monoxide dehydrogenase small subunit